MTGNKQTYYIGIANGEISQSSTDSPWEFRIKATNEEISALREYFNQNYSTGWQNFVRAHIPFIEYHNDKSNDVYDNTLKKVYGMIYQLGDAEAKSHIESMGILENE
ncbi:hydrolase [Bacillus sp. FJAT-29790]|uniref:hydrolase n=1 Tax=Bacillus sp. FJAT-29790 TaxID=1895002 RepID=UPI001C2209CD|nr:hydrolase [Bacillus sp. FJAT-29790]MBU8879853.1 hydrolase [Bacillus sp. FJAT-29790]